MTTLLAQGIAKIATSSMREQAAAVLYLQAEHYQIHEICSRLGINPATVKAIREATGDGLIAAMREQGYADVDIMRTLRVATARVVPVAA